MHIYHREHLGEIIADYEAQHKNLVDLVDRAKAAGETESMYLYAEDARKNRRIRETLTAALLFAEKHQQQATSKGDDL